MWTSAMPAKPGWESLDGLNDSFVHKLRQPAAPDQPADDAELESLVAQAEAIRLDAGSEGNDVASAHLVEGRFRAGRRPTSHLGAITNFWQGLGGGGDGHRSTRPGTPGSSGSSP